MCTQELTRYLLHTNTPMSQHRCWKGCLGVDAESEGIAGAKECVVCVRWGGQFLILLEGKALCITYWWLPPIKSKVTFKCRYDANFSKGNRWTHIVQWFEHHSVVCATSTADPNVSVYLSGCTQTQTHRMNNPKRSANYYLSTYFYGLCTALIYFCQVSH